MSKPYDIYFAGQLVPGTPAEVARANLGKLLKASDAQLNRLFDGKTHLLKRGLDKDATVKYKSVLHKAGIVIVIRQQTDSTSPTQAANQPAFDIAPVGSELLRPEERQIPEPVAVDTAHIKLVSPFTEPTPETRPVPPAPSTDHLSVAAAGEDLLAEKPPAPAPPVLDLSQLSLAPAGSALTTTPQPAVPAPPDLSHLSLAEPGARLTDSSSQPAPPPPDTSHIVLARPGEESRQGE